jgi:hypothetical protein
MCWLEINETLALFNSRFNGCLIYAAKYKQISAAGAKTFHPLFTTFVQIGKLFLDVIYAKAGWRVASNKICILLTRIFPVPFCRKSKTGKNIFRSNQH